LTFRDSDRFVGVLVVGAIAMERGASSKEVTGFDSVVTSSISGN